MKGLTIYTPHETLFWWPNKDYWGGRGT